MLSGSDAGQSRWNVHLTDVPSGSIEQASLPFGGGAMRGTRDNGASITLPNGANISLQGKIGIRSTTPDEDRVTRGEKTSRVRSVTRASAASFRAGSLSHDREPIYGSAKLDTGVMAFARSRLKGNEVEVAKAFYRSQQPAPGNKAQRAFASLINNDRPDILATAYADSQSDYAQNSPFASVLNDDNREGRFVPPITNDDPGFAWATKPLPASAFEKSEQRCLASAVYFESRGEPVKGQAAVAQVVLNRVRNPSYPSTICDVVYQHESWRNRCQFSFACDGKREDIHSPSHWRIAKKVAMAVTAGKIWLKAVGSSTHYHATYVHPRWASAMRRVDKIGAHIFYETQNGGWD
ncbi:cell wall hydrolase [Pararhizobium mangrovi]|uniref:Cell wall hydrolase n=2 Tax=Pararhizobium mangrovi TaxID=2590452 RepID=A0A506U243_9HYPH|nr:cell wall hydrolase [Pararhizobium mangrovi]